MTSKKKDLLNSLFIIYSFYLQKTIDLMWNKKIPIKKNLSSKDIDWMNDLGGQYKQLIYKQASEIVRSCKFKKGKKSKPEIKNLTINLDERMIEVQESKNSFDKWVILKLPFIKEGKKRERIEILIPIKEHKHSLKFKDWTMLSTIKISKTYVSLTFQKEKPDMKQEGEVVGLDSGYKNLLVSSNGQFIGSEINSIYNKIARKTRGSKAFDRALKERDNKIGKIINKELNLDNIKEIKVENLKNLKKGIKGKFRKEFNNKYQYWTYRQVLEKLERTCEENRVLFTKVNPAYTSRTCPKCHCVDKKNRVGEKFLCIQCGYKNHSDVVGAINISRQEPIVPVTFNGFNGQCNNCL